jgi:hypothetical protein
MAGIERIHEERSKRKRNNSVEEPCLEPLLYFWAVYLFCCISLEDELTCPEKLDQEDLSFWGVFWIELCFEPMSMVAFFLRPRSCYSRQGAGSVKGALLSGAPSGNP